MEENLRIKRCLPSSDEKGVQDTVQAEQSWNKWWREDDRGQEPFRENLNLSRFVETYAPLTYRLYGVVYHVGSLETGHYVSATRTPSGNMRPKRGCPSPKNGGLQQAHKVAIDDRRCGARHHVPSTDQRLPGIREVISTKIKTCKQSVNGVIYVKATTHEELERWWINAAVMTANGRMMMDMKEMMSVVVVENVLREHVECN
ncbi:MAG: hypothetical protein LQ342_008437 [Letrouitia transgressa]|nr:MAG: hypothetical protein LQ342_008437 [Letrouitia transgressa]